jgi:hypothetical protein
MPASPELSALKDRSVQAVMDSPPGQQVKRFTYVCHVLGRLVGGGSITFAEARSVAFEVARQARFPSGSLEDVIVLAITEGSTDPGSL